MTEMGVKYLAHREQVRTNVVNEGLKDFANRETNRSNLVNESIRRGTLDETIRSNLRNEGIRQGTLDETIRSNYRNESIRQGTLDETVRTNLANEGIRRDTLSETQRANLVQEGLGKGRLDEEIRHNNTTELNDLLKQMNGLGVGKEATVTMLMANNPRLQEAVSNAGVNVNLLAQSWETAKNDVRSSNAWLNDPIGEAMKWAKNRGLEILQYGITGKSGWESEQKAWNNMSNK